MDLAGDPDLEESFALLRRKWGEVPAGQIRRESSEALLALPDWDLVTAWDGFCRDASVFARRGWRQVLYRDAFRGKRIIDFGCGLAFDTVHFAEHGARVTFVDIAPANVEVVRRLCQLKGVAGCEWLYLQNLQSLSVLHGEYDAVYCAGSLICAPLDVVRREAEALLPHLPAGGRWMELAYPEARWRREGELPFDQWGDKTDGGAPWMEWHDLSKIRGYLAPAEFDVVLAFEYHDHDFNWFDLVRR